jgi:hypothetical protein
MPTRVFPKRGIIDYAHMAITDCDIEGCRHDRKREHYHTLNPRGQAMKEVEMTIVRALALIEEFDALVERFKKEADYTVLSPASYRKALGEYNPLGMEIRELWERYKSRTLHRQVLELAENLVLEDLDAARRKEIKSGLRRISQTLDS